MMTTIAELIAAVDNNEPFDADQVIAITGSAQEWNGLGAEYFAALADMNVDFIDVSGDDGVLLLTLDQARSLADQMGVALAENDTITVEVTADPATGHIDISVEAIVALAEKGLIKFTTTGEATLALTAAQAAALAAADVLLDNDDDVTVVDTGGAIAALSAEHLQALLENGVDGFLPTDGEITLTLEKFGILENVIGAPVTLADTRAVIGGLDADTIATLAGRGVIAIDSTDDQLTLTMDQFSALGGIALTAEDEVSLTDEGGALAQLPAAALTFFADNGIDLLDASDDNVTLTVEQAQILAASDLRYAEGDMVTVEDSAEAICTGLSAEQITALNEKGVDLINVTDENGVLTLNFDQAYALSQTNVSLAGNDTLVVSATATEISAAGVDVIESLAAKGLTAFTTNGAATFAISAAAAGAIATAGIHLDSDDTIKVSGTGGAIAALSINQIQTLIDEGIAGFIVDGGTIALSLAKFALLGDLLDDGAAVTLADTAEALEALDANAIAQLSARGVVCLDSTDDHLTLTLAQYEALGENIALAEGDEITLSGEAVDFVNLAAGQMENLVAKGIDVLQASDDVVLTVEQAMTLAASGLKYSTASIVKVQGDANALAELQAADFTNLGMKGVDTIMVTGDENVLILSVDQAIALADSDLGSIDGDNVVVQGEADAIADLTSLQITKLGQKGVDTFDVTDEDGILRLSVEKALAFAGTSITLASGDSIIVSDTASTLADLTAAQYTLLSGKGIELLDSMEAVNLTGAQAVLLADSELGYVAGDDVTIAVVDADEIQNLTPERLQNLGTKGIDHIWSDIDLTLTVDQAKKLAATTINFTGAGVVTVQGSAGDFAGLTDNHIGALIDNGVDRFDAGGANLRLSGAQIEAFGNKLINAGGITLVDTAANIENADTGALAGHGVVAIDVTGDGLLTLSFAQFSALGTVALTASDTVTVTVSAADLATLDLGDLANKHVDMLDAQDAIILTVEQAQALLMTGITFADDDSVTVAFDGATLPFMANEIAALSDRGVDCFDAEGAVVLTFAQAQALADSNLSFADDDDVSVTLTSAELVNLSGTQLAALADKGIDGFALTGDATLTAEQAAALADTVLTFDAAVSVVDEGAAIAATLSAEDIQALIAKGVTLFDASDDEIALTVAQLDALEGHRAENDAVTLSDSGGTISGLDEDAIGGLAGRGVVAIDVTGDGLLTLSFAQFDALGTVALTDSDTVTLTVSAAELAMLDLGEMANKHVDMLDASEPVTLTADQAFDLISSPLTFAADNTVTITVAEGNMPFDSDDFETLEEKGIDIIDVEGGNGVLAFTVSQALGFTASGITLAAGDTMKVVDTGAALAGLDQTQFNALRTKGFTVFDASDDAISLTVAKLNMFDGHLADEDAITLADDGDTIAGLDTLANLDDMGVVAIDATNNALTLTVAQLATLDPDIALTAGDVVTLSGAAGDFVDLDADDLAALVTRRIDKLHATDAVTLTVAQAITLAASGLGYTAGSNVKVVDSAAAFEDLTIEQITLLGQKGVDIFDLTEGSLRVNAAKAAAFAASGIALADGDTVALSDSGQNISGLTAAQIAALAAQGIASIDATDNVLSLSTAQFNALGMVALTASDTVTLRDTGAALAGLSATQIGQLAAKGIDALDAGDNGLSLSLAQFNALGSVALTASDAVTLSDTGAVLGALSAAQITALAGKGVDVIDARDNALSLSLAQFNALGTVALTAADAVTLADTGASLVGLSAAQMTVLGGRGVDVYNLTDNAVALTAAQLASLGSVDFAAGDRVTVNGTTGADRIAGKSSDDTIKGLAKNDILSGGNGSDQFWGGTGKDVLTGGNGQDIFVFDAALSKANVDKILDFSVVDDTIWLDNKYMKKLGKGSVSKPGKLNKKFFAFDKAKDGNDYIVYVKKTGALYYDEDGSGTKAAVQIATLTKNLKTLSAADFFVI
jgi:Ca2+-binding RTX toxin-like protein